MTVLMILCVGLPWIWLEPIKGLVGDPLNVYLFIAATALFFSLLWYLYFQCFGLMEGSITLSILLSLLRRPGRPLLLEEIIADNGLEQKVSDKIEVMVRHGLMTAATSDGRRMIANTSRGHLVGSIFSRIKAVTHWGPGQ